MVWLMSMKKNGWLKTDPWVTFQLPPVEQPSSCTVYTGLSNFPSTNSIPRIFRGRSVYNTVHTFFPSICLFKTSNFQIMFTFQQNKVI